MKKKQLIISKNSRIKGLPIILGGFDGRVVKGGKPSGNL